MDFLVTTQFAVLSKIVVILITQIAIASCNNFLASTSSTSATFSLSKTLKKGLGSPRVSSVEPSPFCVWISLDFDVLDGLELLHDFIGGLLAAK